MEKKDNNKIGTRITLRNVKDTSKKKEISWIKGLWNKKVRDISYEPSKHQQFPEFKKVVHKRRQKDG